jgi:hypothetical protein
MTRVLINARFRTRPVTGVERFAMEVASRLASHDLLEVEEILPAGNLSGLKGHAWEQFTLPRRVTRDTVLFSPPQHRPARGA